MTTIHCLGLDVHKKATSYHGPVVLQPGCAFGFAGCCRRYAAEAREDRHGSLLLKRGLLRRRGGGEWVGAGLSGVEWDIGEGKSGGDQRQLSFPTGDNA